MRLYDRRRQLASGVKQPALLVGRGLELGEKRVKVAELGARIAAGERTVSAVMVESNLVGGAQDYRSVPLVRGRSVTDACLSWERTVPLIASLAEAVASRRRAGS